MEDNKTSIEKQYAKYFVDKELIGNEIIGSMSTARWRQDPKLLGIALSRYKFVSKMFSDFETVLEVGAGDAWAARVVHQTVKKLTLSDFDSVWLSDFREQAIYRSGNTEYLIHDFTKEALPVTFSGIYALDVLEHIQPEVEFRFLTNICNSLKSEGVAIFGMPSKESQIYASTTSKEGHVNCQSGRELSETLKKHFQNVFIFSMNDEVVHTGFMPMAQYLLALCTNPLKPGE
jgi:hypothetical protein